MENGLRKKYGLFTAIAMVVGIVIGSGVFFKGAKVLNATGGNLPLGILAWAVGGAIMVVCAYVFATMATKYAYVNGLVDYAEVTVGKGYAYYLGWFFATIYYPAITSVLAWVSSMYTCVLLGFSPVGAEAMVIAGFYLIADYALNALAPVIAGKFQVSTAAIKLVPLALMAVVGTIVGLSNGTTLANFSSVTMAATVENPLFVAIVATAFAYDGWIIATSINAELRDAKKNLPIALTAGTLLVVAVYILYYIGLAGAAPNDVIMSQGEAGVKLAFSNIFGPVAGTLLIIFVVISCLGTLNGLMLGATRAIYSLAVRNKGPRPETFKQVDPATNMPANSSVLSLLLCGFWLLFFYAANLTEPWFPFGFDSSELPIIAIYASYIPIFIMFMKKERDLGFFKRFLMPSLAICGCVFMLIATIYAHRMGVVWFLCFLAVFLLAGALLDKRSGKQLKK